jgi:hypothetical protein
MSILKLLKNYDVRGIVLCGAKPILGAGGGK